MTTREILQGARELIADERHWIKGVSKTPYGEFCAVGAVEQVAMGDNFGKEKAWNALNTVVGHNVVQYNDSPDTTHACILAAFDAALEKCDE